MEARISAKHLTQCWGSLKVIFKVSMIQPRMTLRVAQQTSCCSSILTGEASSLQLVLSPALLEGTEDFMMEEGVEQDAPQIGELLSVSLTHANKVIYKDVEVAQQSLLEVTIWNGGRSMPCCWGGGGFRLGSSSAGWSRRPRLDDQRGDTICSLPRFLQDLSDLSLLRLSVTEMLRTDRVCVGFVT
jgi:hypothetical protein